MSTLLSLDIMDSGDAEDFSMKAPYIPMSEGDDLPLLMGVGTDLMWSTGIPSSPTSHTRSGWYV